MKILFAGPYNREYNRNLILEKGLKKLQHQVIHFPFRKWDQKTKAQLIEQQKNVDLVYMPSFSHKQVAHVKRSISKPLIFDPLISRYMTYILDYRKYPRFSWGAARNFFRDKTAFRHADLILADTEAHKNYFSNTFGIDSSKIEVLPIGVDTELFYPGNENTFTPASFTVGYVGGYIPLHGTENIGLAINEIKAYRDIRFVFIGVGHDYQKFRKLCRQLNLNNIEFIGWTNPEKLRELIQGFDLCLGIFGDSVKADIVVPNKIYEYSALKKSALTKDSPGIREVFTDNKNIFLCKNNFKEMAEKILEIKNNPDKNKKVALNTYLLMKEYYTEVEIAKKFIIIVERNC